MRKGSCSTLSVLSSFLPTNSPAHHLLHDLTHIHTHPQRWPWEQGISCNAPHLLAGTSLTMLDVLQPLQRSQLSQTPKKTLSQAGRPPSHDQANA